MKYIPEENNSHAICILEKRGGEKSNMFKSWQNTFEMTYALDLFLLFQNKIALIYWL